MIFDPCNKCIIKVMCKDKCDNKRVYADRLDVLSSAAAMVLVLGLYGGFIVFMLVQ